MQTITERTEELAASRHPASRDGRSGPGRRRAGRARSAARSAAEYMGLLFIVALIIGAIVALDIHTHDRRGGRDVHQQHQERRQAGRRLTSPVALAARSTAIATTRPGARTARSGALRVWPCSRALGAAPAVGAAARRPAVGPARARRLALDERRRRATAAGAAWRPRRRAVDEVLDTVPAEAPLGLRVYGAESPARAARRLRGHRARRAGAPRRPRRRCARRSQALTGKGRTPIGALAARHAGRLPRRRPAPPGRSSSPTASTTARRRRRATPRGGSRGAASS